MATIPSSNYGARTEASLAKKDHTIWWWSVIGVLFTALEGWIFWQWYASGDMRHVDPGVTPVPTWMKTMVMANDIFWGVAIVATAWFYIIRPWMKTGKLTFDAIFILAFVTSWWQDPLYSYTGMTFSYSSVTFSLGSWACHIPGWKSPGGCNLSEPLTWDFAFYFVLSALVVMYASRIMHAIKAKYPDIRTGTLFLGLMAVIMVGDFIAEMSWIAMGVYHYGGVADHMAIFTDTRFKFPLFEPVAVASFIAGFTVIYYFRNDKGETLAERGLDQVNTSPAGKQWLRFFALAGAINAWFFVGFSVPCILFNTQTSPWPKAIQELSFYTNGICGEGTPYACNGNVATARAGQVMNFGPNGEVTMPAGTVKPVAVPLLRTSENTPKGFFQ